MEPLESVFVPAVLGVGIAFSVVTLARDALHRLRGRHWLDRRADLDGRGTALLAAGGEDAARADTPGLRARWVYVVVAAFFGGLVVYLSVGSYGNYVGWTAWVRDIAWIQVLYLVAIALFGWVAVVAGAVALRYERPPPWVRPSLARTPLTFARPAIDTGVAVRRSLGPTGHDPAARPLGPHQVDERVAERARLAAALWSVVALVGYSVLALRDLLPLIPEAQGLEPALATALQVGLLLVITAGTLVARRAEAIGALVMAAGALGLALVVAVDHPSWVAVLVAVAFGIPAFLHWLAWQRHRHVHHLGALALVTLVVLVGITAATDAMSDRQVGPTHPGSTVTSLPESEVEWAWAGATTAEGTTVVARLAEPQDRVRLAVGDGDDLGDAERTETRATDDDRIVRFVVDDLEPDRRYAYALEVDGRLDDGRRGSFRTFPDGAGSFTIAFAGCARTGSNGAVFDAIRSEDPLLYVALGDIHYANIEADDPERFLDTWDAVLSAPAQSLLYRSTSVAYVWDDHDYGGNDADRWSPSRPAALETYREVVPHYPLVADDSPVYQSFDVGRLRVIVTDARSARDPGAPTILGEEQLAWLDAELSEAGAQGRPVVWVNGTPWIDDEAPGSDTWGGYPREREQVARMIDDAGLEDRLVMLSGDAHMAAIDDGTNSGMVPGVDGFPVAHGNALDRPGGSKGGPFSEGMFPGSGQYGLLEVTDDGGPEIEVALVARTWDGRELTRLDTALLAG